MVSRLSMLERRHPRTHALTPDCVFNYHMRMTSGREARLDSSMRSTCGGAISKEVALEKAEDK
eukprot:1746878-Pleurochrysis_carterae.AAC.1